MTKTKQFYTVFFAICLLVPALFLFTACAGNNGPTSDRMMTMSINPEVTFVVDKDNKISSILLETKMLATFTQMSTLKT